MEEEKLEEDAPLGEGVEVFAPALLSFMEAQGSEADHGL